MAHSVSVITNGVTPSDRISRTRAARKRISFRRNRNRLLRVQKNAATAAQEQACDSTVARLDPATPM